MSQDLPHLLRGIALKYKDAPCECRCLWGTILYFWSTPSGVHGKKWSPCGNWMTICLTAKSSFIQLTTLLSFRTDFCEHLVPTRARRGRYRLSSTVAMLLLLHTSAQTSSTAYQRVEKIHPPWPAFSANRKKVQAALGKRQVQSNHHSRIGIDDLQRSYPGEWLKNHPALTVLC